MLPPRKENVDPVVVGGWNSRTCPSRARCEAGGTDRCRGRRGRITGGGDDVRGERRSAGGGRGNVDLRTLPTARAGEIYDGVLYQALDLPGLDAGGRRRAGRSVLISSALFGVLRLGDRIPPYKLSMGRSSRCRTAGQVLARSVGHGVVRSRVRRSVGRLPFRQLRRGLAAGLARLGAGAGPRRHASGEAHPRVGRPCALHSRAAAEETRRSRRSADR